MGAFLAGDLVNVMSTTLTISHVCDCLPESGSFTIDRA